jgi:hypothetical protein
MRRHAIWLDSESLSEDFLPLLAEAVQGYPHILRFQAMECFPLNNMRPL